MPKLGDPSDHAPRRLGHRARPLSWPSQLALAALCVSACATTRPDPAPPSGSASSQAPAACVWSEPDPAPAPCEDDDDMCRVDRMGDSRVGWLALGSPLEQAQARLGTPDEVTDPEIEGASGESFRIFTWQAAGVRLDVREGQPGQQVVHSFMVRPPFEGLTERCVGLGSALAQVERAYAGLRDPNMEAPTAQGGTFIAGSVYGGIFFHLDEQGRVSSIFVGAGAE